MSGTFSRPQRQHLRIAIDFSLPQVHTSPSPESTYASSPMSDFSFSSVTPTTGTPDWFICNVICMFDFESDDPDHLPFTRNEILTIVKMEESGWWAAMRPKGDRLGWIPSSFVEHIPETTALEEQDKEPPHICIDDHEGNARISETDSDSEFIQLDKILSSVSDVVKLARGGHHDSRRNDDLYDSFFSLSVDDRSPPHDFTRPSPPALYSIPQPPITPRSPVSHVLTKPVVKLNNSSIWNLTVDPERSLPPSPYPRHPRPRPVLVNDHDSLSCLSAIIDQDHPHAFHALDNLHVKETFDAFSRKCHTEEES